MYKKILLSICITVALVFSVTYTFAANMLEDAANGVRNVVGGAENAVEDAAKDVSNTSKDITGDMENAGKSVVNDANNNGSNNSENMGRNNDDVMRATDNGSNYTATKTATTGNNATVLGMTSNTWTWLILGIAAIAIVALVWYYSTQITGDNHYNDHNEN